MEELNELRKVAEAATPGPWQWGPEKSHWGDCGPNLETVERGPLYADGSQGAAAEVVGSWGHDANGISAADEDKDFIATFDPPTVLALLSRLEQAEARVKLLESGIVADLVITSVHSASAIGATVSGISESLLKLGYDGLTERLEQAERVCVNGYIGERVEGGQTIHILQCQDCTAVEETGHLILMTFKFVRCSKDPEPVRRCPDCTTKHLDACDYPGHNRDRNRR